MIDLRERIKGLILIKGVNAIEQKYTICVHLNRKDTIKINILYCLNVCVRFEGKLSEIN